MVRDDDRDEVGFQGVPVDEDVVDDLIALVDILDFFRGDVLAVLQFKNVLFAVDDLERVVGHHEPDVAAVEPAVGVDGFPGFRL